jgi:O-antigen/teichoic acid export membrane protein
VYAVSVKLATAVIVAVRGFQLAWAPLAYSITDDDEARRFYARVTTWFVVVTGLVVAGMALLGRWLVRLLTEPRYYEAEEALPWVALGWACYGLFHVFVVIAGRAKITRTQLPAALVGLVVNTVLLVLLVDPLGITGAGIALGAAYLAMMAVLGVLTRRAFAVPFEVRRLVHAIVVLAGVAVLGDLLLPEAGVVGFVTRALALAADPGAAAGQPLRVPGGDGVRARAGPAASSRALNASAASRIPSPRCGRSDAVTWRAYRRGSWPGSTSAAAARSA